MAMQRGPADAVIEDKLSIISNLHVTDETELTIERIIELAIVAVLRDGIRLLVLDPWNEIEHKRGRDESETRVCGQGHPAAQTICKGLSLRRVGRGPPAQADP